MHPVPRARAAGLIACGSVLVVALVALMAFTGPATAGPPGPGEPAVRPTPDGGWGVTDHRREAFGTPPRHVPTVPRSRPVTLPPPRPIPVPTSRPVVVAAPSATRTSAGPTAPELTVSKRSASKPSASKPSAPTPRATTPRAATSGAVTTSGWHSGATGPGAADGTIGAGRGRGLQIIGLFADTTGRVQGTLPALGSVAGYDGDVDIALGGLTDDTPETWARAAKGAYLARWTQAARTLRTARGGRAGTVYVRFAHEANADWFPWRVTAADVADFRTSWRLFHDVLAREFPQARLVFCANSGGRTDVGIERMWPGDDVVDVVAVDVHAGWEPVTPADWQQRLDEVTTDGGPRGLAAWLAFANRHGKPLAVSRWGLDAGGAAADDGTRIRLMHAFLSSNAAVPGGDPRGRVLYDIFFDHPVGSDSSTQLTDPRNTMAAAVYRGLVWGS